MKLTVTFENGKKVSAFVNDNTKKMLTDYIIEVENYEDESEITDRNIIDYAISEHDYFRIFDKEYSSHDIESYEVEHDVEETLAEKQERILSYLSIYNEALSYAEEFFRYEMRTLFLEQPSGHGLSPSILPITFITEGWEGDRINAQFTCLGNQAVIYVLLQESELSEELKLEIRHEIIHYTLWLVGLPHTDDSPEFWALATVYNSDPYIIMTGEKYDYYKEFMRFFRETWEPLNNTQGSSPMLIRLGLGKAISGMRICNNVKLYGAYLKKIEKKIEGSQ